MMMRLLTSLGSTTVNQNSLRNSISLASMKAKPTVLFRSQAEGTFRQPQRLPT